MQEQFEGAELAQKAIKANTSPRYRRLESLERWVDGTQYHGLKSWWDDEVPLWERAPCLVYPVVQIAIQSNVDLVLGEGRFPTFSAKPDEDEGTDESGTTGDAAEDIDRYLAEYHRACRFKSHCREALSAAQGCGTVVAIHGARGGKPFADLIPAKWATPLLPDGKDLPGLGQHGEVLKLEIRYPYIEEYRKSTDGKWAVRARLYRRVIDGETDTTYLPADAQPNGIEPDWQVDTSKTGPHGLGFCPVIWYPFMRGCAPVNVIDGKAIHQNIRDAIRAHDIAISQRHRGALLSEPQMCEFGVQPGYNPTDVGRLPSIASVDDQGRIVGAYRDAGPAKTARKKGPGYVNQYEDKESYAEYLAPPASAYEAMDKNARDIRVKLMQSLAVVLLDHEGIEGLRELSGKALEAIKQSQLDRCDQFRDDVKDGFLLPSVDMQLRISQKLGKSLKVPGIEKMVGALSKFEAPEPKPRGAVRAVG